MVHSKWLASYYRFWLSHYRQGLALAFLGKSHFIRCLIEQLGAILSGVNALAIFFFFPETQYFRKYENSPVLKNNTDNTESTEKDVAAQEVQDAMPPVSTPSIDSSSPPKRTFLQELKPWSGINPHASLISLLFRPWPFVVYPVVIYLFLLYSVVTSWAVIILNTNATLFQSPPYNMTPGINSLLKIPSIIGITVGIYVGGGLNDRYCAWRARKNNGVFEPETRLEALTLPFFIVPAGLLMFFSLFATF
jgi:hypothetical protein